jgi:hypothetical protein
MKNEPDRSKAEWRERFRPGAQYDGLQAAQVGKVVEDALFRAAMKGLTLNVTLDVDNFHVVVTVIDSVPDDRERPPYDD